MSLTHCCSLSLWYLDAEIVIAEIEISIQRSSSGLLTNVLLNIQDEEKLRWSFRLYDMDNNGVIDIEEMVVIIETLDSIEGVKPGDTNVERKIKSPKV